MFENRTIFKVNSFVMQIMFDPEKCGELRPPYTTELSPGYLGLELKTGQIKGNAGYFQEDMDKISPIDIFSIPS